MGVCKRNEEFREEINGTKKNCPAFTSQGRAVYPNRQLLISRARDSS